MAEYEASSYTAGYESSYASEASESTLDAAKPADQEEGRTRKYALVSVVLLLLLFFILGSYSLIEPGSTERKDAGDSTADPVYAVHRGPKNAPPGPPTTTPTTSTTKRPLSTGYGYLVCTIGRSFYTPATLPIKQELCDFIIFTHVIAVNGTLSSATGNTSYKTFLKAAGEHKDDEYTKFGLSYSPHALTTKLQGKENATSLASSFLQPAQKVFAEAGLSAIGVMGLVRKVNEFTHEPKLTAWFKEVATSVAKLPNVTVTLFVGLRLKENGADLSSKQKLATDVFRVVKKMEVKLLVLVTHTALETGQSSCVSQPVSSWTSSVYKDSSRPALENIFKFLTFGLADETELEVALSSTLAVARFVMKKPVVGTVQFGQSCVRSTAMAFEATCIPAHLSRREHEASITAYASNDTTLYSFETASTVDRKMRRFVMPLDDKVHRRVGWAFFDLAFEVYNKSACLVQEPVDQDFPRLSAGKLVLEENRNRKFP